jgi:hypothetical protein
MLAAIASTPSSGRPASASRSHPAQELRCPVVALRATGQSLQEKGRRQNRRDRRSCGAQGWHHRKDRSQPCSPADHSRRLGCRAGQGGHRPIRNRRNRKACARCRTRCVSRRRSARQQDYGRRHRRYLCPRHVQRKPLKGGGWGYFFNISTKARKKGCPLRNEALGADYAAAVARAETVLLLTFDAWQKGIAAGVSSSPALAAVDTLDWMFSEYRSDRRYTELTRRASAITRPNSSWSVVTC